jgi:hypothetical protein
VILYLGAAWWWVSGTDREPSFAQKPLGVARPSRETKHRALHRHSPCWARGLSHRFPG